MHVVLEDRLGNECAPVDSDLNRVDGDLQNEWDRCRRCLRDGQQGETDNDPFPVRPKVGPEWLDWIGQGVARWEGKCITVPE